MTAASAQPGTSDRRWKNTPITRRGIQVGSLVVLMAFGGGAGSTGSPECDEEVCGWDYMCVSPHRCGQECEGAGSFPPCWGCVFEVVCSDEECQPPPLVKYEAECVAYPMN